MKNRISASFLSLALALSLAPASALATEEPQNGESANEQQSTFCTLAKDRAQEAGHNEICAVAEAAPLENTVAGDDPAPSDPSAATMPFTVNQGEGGGYEIGEEVVNGITVNILKITTDGYYTIAQTDMDKPVTDWRIEIAADAGTVELVLSGLNIDLTGTGSSASNRPQVVGCCPLSITGACDTTVTLADGSTNSLVSGAFRAGIENNTHPIAIQCETAKANGHHDCAEDSACGSLAAESTYGGAGIGGYGTDDLDTGAGANIEIRGGLITARGSSATGIGGSYGPGYNIAISGGNVKAYSSWGGLAAAIGGGNGFDGYNITIVSGTVYALSDSSYAAAIGGGFKGHGKNIAISGGDVTAICTSSGAGIGGGGFGNGEDITISGGAVSASSGTGAGIGGGQLGASRNIFITGGTIAATSNGNGAGIGAGGSWTGQVVGDAENIQITAPADVTVTSKQGVSIGGASTNDPDVPGGNANNILITTPIKTTEGLPLTVGAGSGAGGLKGEEASIAYVDENATVHITTADGEKISATPSKTGEQIVIGQDHQLTIPENGATIVIGDDEAEKTVSGGSIVHVDGTVDIPAGGDCDGTPYPNGAIVKPDGSVLKRTVLTLASNSGTVEENIGSFSFAYAYDGDGAVSAVSSSPETAEATVDQTAQTVTVTVKKAGDTSIVISAEETKSCVAPEPVSYALTINPYFPSRPSSNHAVSVGEAAHGKVSVSPSYAKKGETVTVTVDPDEGYKLDELNATDLRGKTVELKDEGDGKFTFTMPDSKVDIKAIFGKADAGQEELVFTDVPSDAYYADAVKWAVAESITTGTSDTTFSPEDPCTRGQMVTFLWRANGSPEASGNNPFVDVDVDAYYYDAVLWAAEKGITTGTSDTTFSPEETLTRDQAVTFLWRANGSPVASGHNFEDVPSDAYYANAVAWAATEGITTGTSDTTFSPEDDCVRAQIVTFMHRNAK